jgi:hypothetical protein
LPIAAAVEGFSRTSLAIEYPARDDAEAPEHARRGADDQQPLTLSRITNSGLVSILWSGPRRYWFNSFDISAPLGMVEFDDLAITWDLQFNLDEAEAALAVNYSTSGTVDFPQRVA